ncbi:minor capsid protein [Clostridiaceae bacterium AF29-16BH]|nr:minor capsid protein [Clostridiaceae bacterium AF29-16BH]
MRHNEYDLAEAFQRIENELMASMIRNMDRHRAEETEEGYNWSMWQAEQLKALEKYKRNNQRKYRKQFKNINNQIEELIRQARQTGNMQQEIRILQAIKKGWKVHGKNKSPAHQTMIAEFFKLNDRKLEALIKATRQDMEKAETAVLRKAEDDYRKAIFNAQVYANTGSGTYEKAVDMATKDMLSRGLNCVEYANGARHTLADYADMAIRTASKRAYLQGEGEKRQEWGVTTVIMAKRGNPCPKCLPFVGKVLIDDVWSGGRSDGVDSETGKRYPLMSYAISKGLYHPRCKDSHTTYFPGISTADDTWTEEELKKVGLQAKQEAQQQYAQRQKEKYDRLAKYSLDPENKRNYSLKAGEWKRTEGSNDKEMDILDAHSKFIDKMREDEQPSLHKDKLVMYSEFTDLIEDENIAAPFAYVPGEDVIKYNPSASHVLDYDMDYVFSHEVSHRMDFLEYQSWKNDKFLKAIETCSEKVYAQREEIQKWFDVGGKYEDSFALSDIIGALSNGSVDVPIGHDVSYWNEDPRNKPMEIFANLSSIDVLELDEKEDILKELFEAYKELIK